MEDFSNRLKKLRIEKNLLQRELAEMLNLTRPAITYYELGKRFPDQGTLKKIADFFDVSIDYLVGRIDFRNPNIHELKEAYSSQTDHLATVNELPNEAQKLLEEFREFLIVKYGRKNKEKN